MNVTGALALGGTITLIDTGSALSGSYTIFTYTGALSGTASVTPPPGFAAALDTTTPGVVKVMLTANLYATWSRDHFTPTELANPAISGPDATPANDGLTNLMKYALGLPPKTPSTTGITISRTGGDWQLVYQRPANRADLIYAPEVSYDLSVGSWTNGGVIHERVATGDPEVWRGRVASAPGGRLFLRLRVTQELIRKWKLADSGGDAHASLMRGFFVVFAVAFVPVWADASAVETLRLPLSGRGPSDAVEWDFQVTGGRRAGEKAKIPVPSQWEQHGFGDYDYGIVPGKDKHKEDGIYQRNFTVPEDWRGMRVRIVFEGSMTDTTVTVNGVSAGPVHQGGFYRFHHDITDLVRFGAENRLEVLVSKDSANLTIEEAERGADYWVFGGIYRPVWLEARPPQSIEWTAIDAEADGSLRALVHLAGAGRGGPGGREGVDEGWRPGRWVLPSKRRWRAEGRSN